MGQTPFQDRIRAHDFYATASTKSQKFAIRFVLHLNDELLTMGIEIRYGGIQR